MVLITPQPSQLSSFSQLTRPEVNRLTIGEPRTVPAGHYATKVLKKLGIFDRVQAKFVLVNNGQAVLTAVATRSVDAGIVDLTDAKNSPNIAIAATADAKLH